MSNSVYSVDKRLIYGVLAVIIVVGGLYVFVINKPPAPPENGDDNGNGVVVPPEDKAIIEGVVSDEAGDPVSGATVTVDGETVTTGSDGAYSFEVDAGVYTVSVSKDGYDDVSSILTVVSDTDYTVDLAILETETDTGTDRIELKIITRHGSDILFKARAAFLETNIAAEYGITEREQIKFLGVSSSLWTDTIKRSGDIDIAWGGGPVVFDIVNSEGLLSPLESDEVTAILNILPDEISGAASKRIIDGDVMWVAYAQFNLFPSVTAIGTADATLSTSNTRMFEIILQTYGWEDGWELLTLMGANSRIFDKSESVRDAAIQGIIGAGTTIDFYGYTAQLEEPDLCKYVLPQDGTAVNADPIALVSTSEEPEAAQAFIAWVLSPEGQGIWLDETINRMPINPAVFDTALGQTRPDLEESYTRTLEAITIDFSDELALSYETAMMFFFKGTLVEAQVDLIDTWIEMVDAEDAGDITHKEFLGLVEDLGNPLNIEFTDPETGSTLTFTESYAQSINDRITTDADFKSTLRDAWRAAAIVRYNTVLDDLFDLTG
jgi:ABC-type Fe3+ transport system substrate-binding protein